MSKKLKAIKEASISIACLLDEVENKKIKKDLEHIQNQITILEQLDYPELSTSKHHIWLDETIGFTTNKLNASKFEDVIGALNEELSQMYGCQICYDEEDGHFSGFMIEAFLEQLDYPELSTKDINKIVEKYGWKPMDTKDGLAWFGGKTHSCLGDHIADEHEDFENIDFLVAGWRRSDD